MQDVAQEPKKSFLETVLGIFKKEPKTPESSDQQPKQEMPVTEVAAPPEAQAQAAAQEAVAPPEAPVEVKKEEEAKTEPSITEQPKPE